MLMMMSHDDDDEDDDDEDDDDDDDDDNDGRCMTRNTGDPLVPMQHANSGTAEGKSAVKD